MRRAEGVTHPGWRNLRSYKFIKLTAAKATFFRFNPSHTYSENGYVARTVSVGGRGGMYFSFFFLRVRKRSERRTGERGPFKNSPGGTFDVLRRRDRRVRVRPSVRFPSGPPRSLIPRNFHSSSRPHPPMPRVTHTARGPPQNFA